MKKKLIFLTIFIFLFSCKKDSAVVNKPKKTNGFQIVGHITNANNQEVYLQSKNLDNTFTTLNKTIIHHNKFTFLGVISNPKLVYVGFENTEDKISIVANNFQTFITADSQNLENAVVLGSKLQTDYNNYLNRLLKATKTFSFKLNYIKSNANSLVSALILEQMLGKTKWRLEQNRKGFDYLSSEIKKSELGKKINTFLLKNEPLVQNEIENSKKAAITLNLPTKKVPNKGKKSLIKKKPKVKKNIRRKALNFSAKSQYGNDISLVTVKKNAKVTLVDFWASWCEPCRKTHPHLKQLYAKYHSKGFNIISISEDKDSHKNSWKTAIKVDGLSWAQVIDDYGRLAEMYNVESIPHSFLLDKNGGIIFHKKTVYTLEQKLKEIFGF